MYKRILLAYDGSEAGQKALLDTQEFASLTKGEVYLIAVMPPAATFMGGEGYVYDKEAEDEERRQHQATLDEGLARLVNAGHRASGELVVGEAVDEITRYAKKIDADLDRRRPQAPVELGRPLVARLGLEGADRAGELQRARRDHEINGV
jgi:nucleotide-binding universal stress UspA family protein